MAKGIRIVSEDGTAFTTKVFNNETNEEIPYVTELKLHCLPGEAIKAEIHVLNTDGFDITVLPENVTVIMKEDK